MREIDESPLLLPRRFIYGCSCTLRGPLGRSLKCGAESLLKFPFLELFLAQPLVVPLVRRARKWTQIPPRPLFSPGPLGGGHATVPPPGPDYISRGALRRAPPERPMGGSGACARGCVVRRRRGAGGGGGARRGRTGTAAPAPPPPAPPSAADPPDPAGASLGRGGRWRRAASPGRSRRQRRGRGNRGRGSVAALLVLREEEAEAPRRPRRRLCLRGSGRTRRGRENGTD